MRKHIKRLSLLLLLLTMGIISVQAQSKAEKKADAAFDRQDYPKAVKLYKKLLSKSNNPMYVIRIAESFRLSDYPVRAADWYSKVPSFDAVKPIYSYNYGLVLKSNAKFEEAKQMFMAYNSAVPNDSRGLRQIEACQKADEFLTDNGRFQIARANINSNGADFSPAFYRDGIIFSSEANVKDNKKLYYRRNAPYLDLMYAKQVGSDPAQFNKASNLDAPITTGLHEGTVSFAPDYSIMYFTANTLGEKNKKKKVINLKIFQAKGPTWDKVAPFPFNSDKYSVGHPAITPDGMAMYFVSDMPNGYGGTDVYVTYKNGSSWGVPENLGPEINTEGNEMFPFIGGDGTLYFSSDALPGLGGLDVFESKPLGNNNWSTPANLRFPINSNGDDFGFIINEVKQIGYFTSNRSGGKGGDDIYAIKLGGPPQEQTVNVQPAPTPKFEPPPPPKCPPAGTPCNDNNPSTVDDQEDGNCRCIGVVPAPAPKPTPPPPPPAPTCPPAGTPCNDNNPNTMNDKEDGNCRCKGFVPAPPPTPKCPPAGTRCNDNNPQTIDDKEDGACHCIGYIPDTPPPPKCPAGGTPCNDGDPATIDDKEDGNCHCRGYIPEPPPSPKCPPAGTPCNDGDPATVDDKEDGACHCLGYVPAPPPPPPAPPQQLDCRLEGKIFDKNGGQAISGATIKLFNESTGQSQTLVTRENGLYTFIMESNTDYSLFISKSDYFTEPKKMSTKGRDCGSDLQRDLSLNIFLSKIDLSETIKIVAGEENTNADLPLPTLKHIYYDLDSDVIREDAKIELNKIISFMLANPGLSVELGAHTDARGSGTYNQTLSERRAESARRYVISKGVNPSSITGIGYGETQLVNECSDGVDCPDYKHQQNRRTEFTLTGYIGPPDGQ